jgi:ubiquinone/menaquinone biosynthesis C-methylase UbiE
MKIKYKETVSDLAKRIDIHQKYGSRDIDQWMLELLNLKRGSNILDIGCGHGKQCFLFYEHLKGDCQIVGGDISQELLREAKKQSRTRGIKIKFQKIDFNKKLPLKDSSFNLLTCCFAIYYAKDISFTINEMFRVLKPEGRLFVTGPMPNNKKVFYTIIKKATKKPIPSMPGSSRFSTEIFQVIKKRFPKTEIHIFRNPLIFKEVNPFIDYSRASLSEDRKIWSNLFVEESFNSVIDKITKVSKGFIKKDGQIVMTKVVGGLLAFKNKDD